MTQPRKGRHLLSKSTFIRGCQCQKSLYLYKHDYKSRDPLSPEQRAIFARGTNVGLLAGELFPDGINAGPPTPFQYAKSVELTNELIGSGREVIYEAAFMTEGVLAAMDILVRDQEASSPEHPVYRAYEVKSSTGISDTYLLDAALQYWVITGAGLELSDISIVHIDSSYVRRGDLDISRLFRSESVLDEALDRQELVARKVVELTEVVQGEEMPKVDIGPHCNVPYPCDFQGTCWNEVPEYSVFDIARLAEEKKFELYHQGVREVAQVPDGYPLSDRQKLQVQAERDGKPRIDREAIAAFLETLRHPLFFIDFESFQPAVPLFEDSSPYQQIPFQFSLHAIEGPKTALRHDDFLAEAGPDPRREFLEHLLRALGPTGSVLVYNKTFEATRLKELAELYEDLAPAVGRILDRVVDLMTPFQNQSFYLPAMQGSYSIKRVLPAIAPDLSYDGLGIQNGTHASAAFETLFDETSPRRRAWIRKQLLDYCRMDTYAMVKIYEALAGEAERVTA